MQRSHLDGDVDDVAVLDPRARPEAADHDGLVRALCRRGLHGTLLAHVARELAHVLGEGGWSSDGEVRDDLRSERLAQHYDSAHALILGRLGLERRVLEVLRPHADDDLASDVALERGSSCQRVVSQGQRVLAQLNREAAVAPLDAGFDQVHRGGADEAADEEIHRSLVQLLWRRHLLDLAFPHHGDAIAHRHRLDLVVRDVDRRHAELGLQARDLSSHVHAELRVQVRERLVHQVRGRLAHDRPAHRHPLALSARESAGLAVEELLEPENASRFADALVDLFFRRLSQLEAEGDVVVHAQVWVERVALEDHRDVAVASRQAIHDAVTDSQDAFTDVLEPGDHAQRRRLAATRGADQHHELPVGDRQVHAGHGPRSVGIDLAHSLEGHSSHGELPATLQDGHWMTTSTGA